MVLALGLLIIGFAAGRVVAGAGTARAGNELAMHAASSPEVAATATRGAELLEISDLQTRVARNDAAAACTPAVAAPTPTPVPPVASGVPVPYGQDWIVTVVDISMVPTVGDATSPGVFARISINAVNNSTTAQRFPYDELVLRDARGRVFTTSQSANSNDLENWYAKFSPSVSRNGYVYFDVAADAQGPFVLESTAVPDFRVLIDVEQRG
jgi:hypothetical protein